MFEFVAIELCRGECLRKKPLSGVSKWTSTAYAEPIISSSVIRKSMFCSQFGVSSRALEFRISLAHHCTEEGVLLILLSPHAFWSASAVYLLSAGAILWRQDGKLKKKSESEWCLQDQSDWKHPSQEKVLLLLSFCENVFLMRSELFLSIFLLPLLLTRLSLSIRLLVFCTPEVL